MQEENILKNTFSKVGEYLNNTSSENKVLNYRSPEELKEEVNFPIGAKGVDEAEFMSLIESYLKYAVNTANPQFLNQLYSGFNMPAFLGEVITVLSNTSMYTYEVAPMATLIEKEMIKLLISYIGFNSGDGIFVTGGSNANMIAMFSARNKKFPDFRFKGNIDGLTLTAFVNEKAHYSFDTAANLLGIGANNVIKVKADEKGRMISSELSKEIDHSIARGEHPFFVAATCGTTVQGAYDPIHEIADICEKHNLWLHSDGSFGGTIILSEKHRHLMDGIERSDSFAWNPHKLMNIPLVCSVILVKDPHTLYHNLTDINTDYIYHNIEDIDDLGKKSIQCGRRVDAVKLWFAWKYYGLEGYQKRTDNLIEMAEYAEHLVNEHPNLEMVAPRQSFTVCFRYNAEGVKDHKALNMAIREELRKNGLSIVNFAYIDNIHTIRLVITNGATNKVDIEQFFHNFVSAGTNIVNQTTLDD